MATPTRKQYVDYMGTLKGGYGPAKGLRNNDNDFNTRYYGRRVSGNDYAWCAVFEWDCERHFGIDKVNGGKVAYVPNMVGVGKKAGAKVWHKPSSVPQQGTSWAQPGNKVTFDFNRSGEAEHTGTFIKRLSSTTFLSREGNTSTGQYSDAVADKVRSVHDVLDVIELLGVKDDGPSTPITPPKPGELTVDGVLGSKTIALWQHIMKTPVDGKISHPSTLVRAVQTRLHATVDHSLVVDGEGIIQNGHRYKTVGALQRYLGSPVDQVISEPTSQVVKALQRRLNTGKF